jgi:hypothetical protein
VRGNPELVLDLVVWQAPDQRLGLGKALAELGRARTGLTVEVFDAEQEQGIGKIVSQTRPTTHGGPDQASGGTARQRSGLTQSSALADP